MKILNTFVFFGLVLAACSRPSITEEEAFKLIAASKGYPQMLSYQVYTKDAEDGRLIMDAGLVKEGLATVARDHKTGENQKPIIEFTEAGKAFLLPADKGQLSSVQKVKIAEEVIDSIVAIQINEQQKTAVVTYTSKYTNVNPFSRLDKKDYTQVKKHEVTLLYTKDGWTLK
ncbi:hypothetical protein [Olivibacter sp. XZL3]|uniref:hypothetical protein n=1 Tax=Olivibacter sp. XZL3 TaxID=1735116 RepID=UPI001065C698|nr:hypothetical protein [Olivibacter sp. XZL3]